MTLRSRCNEGDQRLIAFVSEAQINHLLGDSLFHRLLNIFGSSLKESVQVSHVIFVPSEYASKDHSTGDYCLVSAYPLTNQ